MKYQDLKILDELREKGSITEEEYQREKEKILNCPDESSSGTATQKPLFGLEENTYLMLMHLSQLAGILIPVVGFVLPVIMWLTNKENNAKVDLHGKNIMNFMISFLIYGFVCAITIILIPLSIVVGIVFLVFLIMASVKANSGTYWKYPLTIQFLK